jgi:alkylation response protein AidB-like acyl-CoA dehydrogenase
MTGAFVPSAEAEELRATVRALLAKRHTETDARAAASVDPGYDVTLWAEAAEQLGVHGLAVPEEFGGSAATPVELGVVFEEMGAALYTGPFLSSVGMATSVLVLAGDEQAQVQYLPALASGTSVGTLAWGGADARSSTLRTQSRDGEWRVSGIADVVIEGAAADLFVVLAETPDGPGLLTVEHDDRHVRRAPLTVMDETRRLASVEFTDAPARRLEGPTPVIDVIERTLDLAALYLAAEQLGGATRVLQRAVEYAGERWQFGRPIGSFQAIRHRCAGMLVDVEAARSVVQHGLWSAVHQPAELPVAAALARSVTSDVYARAAAANIQIHGGIGFTWEHHAHLYLKRAKSSQLLLGPPTSVRLRLARLLGITGDAPAAAGADDRDAAVPRTELDDRIDDFLARHPVPAPGDDTADRRFREARFDAGLAFVHFAPGAGGLGLDAALQPAVEARFAAAGATDHTERNIIGLGMALATIQAHGTDDQRARFLRPGFAGAEIWCQLFSEPGAGSDLAGLATRAVRESDEFVVNGQKVWTSLGHVASHGILLARTDPDVPKHRGLTYFLLDMRTPGVEVRPLRQLTGEAEFNEVYLTDVRVPASAVLGEVGQGWAVAMTTLASERFSLGARPSRRGSGPIGQAVEMYRRAAAEGRVDAATTERLMLLWTRAEAARLTNVRATARPGFRPGPEGSIAKLEMAELNQAVYEFCVDIAGPAGLLIDGYAETAPARAAVHGGTDVRKAYLRSLANSIEGGTSEILRDILGTRVLGLPGEPRTDRDIPWRQVRRS